MPDPDERPRRGRPRGEAPRRAVFDAIAKLVRETSSYDLLTIEGISAASGVAKSTIYRRWDSKSDILMDAFISGDLRIGPRDVDRSDDVRRDVLGWIIAMRDEMTQPDHLNLVRTLMMAGLDTRRSVTVPDATWSSEQLAARLREAVAAGELGSGHDVSIAAAALSHTVILAIATSGPPDDAWCAQLVDLVLAGLGPRRD